MRRHLLFNYAMFKEITGKRNTVYSLSISIAFCTGLEPGTVVISEAAVDGLLRPYMEVVCDI